MLVIGTGWPDHRRKRTMVFRNTKYTRRNYDCTNVVACEADKAPSRDYVPCDRADLNDLFYLYTANGAVYFGHR